MQPSVPLKKLAKWVYVTKIRSDLFSSALGLAGVGFLLDANELSLYYCFWCKSNLTNAAAFTVRMKKCALFNFDVKQGRIKLHCFLFGVFQLLFVLVEAKQTAYEMLMRALSSAVSLGAALHRTGTPLCRLLMSAEPFRKLSTS